MRALGGQQRAWGGWMKSGPRRADASSLAHSSLAEPSRVSPGTSMRPVPHCPLLLEGFLPQPPEGKAKRPNQARALLWCAHHEGVGGDASWLTQWPLPQLGGSQVSEGIAWEARAKIQLTGVLPLRWVLPSSPVSLPGRPRHNPRQGPSRVLSKVGNKHVEQSEDTSMSVASLGSPCWSKRELAQTPGSLIHVSDIHTVTDPPRP